eukprot:7289715-Prymnesium_polylepis.1
MHETTRARLPQRRPALDERCKAKLSPHRSVGSAVAGAATSGSCILAEGSVTAHGRWPMLWPMADVVAKG